MKYVTVYAFSTENWSRPKEEIDTLMGLLRDFLKECIKKSKKNNMRVRILGDVARLDRDLQEKFDNLSAKSDRSRNELMCMALQFALEHLEFIPEGNESGDK